MRFRETSGLAHHFKESTGAGSKRMRRPREKRSSWSADSVLEALRQQRERLMPWLRHNFKCAVAAGWVGGDSLDALLAWQRGDEKNCTCGLAAALGLTPDAIERKQKDP